MSDAQSGINTDIDPTLSFQHMSSGNPITDGATVTMADLVNRGAIRIETIDGYGQEVAARVRSRLPGQDRKHS